MHIRRGAEVKGIENNVLITVFEAKRDEITGKWRRLYNAELHTVYS